MVSAIHSALSRSGRSEQFPCVCRATISSSLVGMIHNCTRLPLLWIGTSPLAFSIADRVERDAEPVEVGTDGRSHRRRVLADAAGEDDGVGAVRATASTRRGNAGPRRRRHRAPGCACGSPLAAAASMSRRSLQPLSPSKPERLARSSSSCSSVLPVAAHAAPAGRRRSKSPTRLLCGKPALRTHAHAGRYRLAGLDGAQRTAAAQVAGDDLGIGIAAATAPSRSAM